MKIGRYLIGGLFVGLISLAYNSLVFAVFDFFPDLPVGFSIFGVKALDFYLVIFLKNFLVGIILMYLFSVGYRNIADEKGRHDLKGIFFIILYAIFALVAFSLGDILLMGSEEGLFVLLTVDGMVETLIATLPVKFFSERS